MRLKVLFLSFESFLYRYSIVDVLLGSAFYTIITQVQRVRLITQKFKCICAFIHQIDLRDDTDRTFTSWINGFRELERI
jgi:hypothetical protein